MIEPAPGVHTVEKDVEGFLEHLLARWRLPLTRVEEKRFGETCKTRWGQDMSCESMLEHAVVHSMRHSFQLEQIMLFSSPSMAVRITRYRAGRGIPWYAVCE
jgi:hypothetical protein